MLFAAALGSNTFFQPVAAAIADVRMADLNFRPA
jgi:hypothetical protein